MGEYLETLGYLELNGKVYDIECNESPTNPSNYIIHIQSEQFRFEVSAVDLYQYLSCFLSARDQLRSYKKI